MKHSRCRSRKPSVQLSPFQIPRCLRATLHFTVTNLIAKRLQSFSQSQLYHNHLQILELRSWKPNRQRRVICRPLPVNHASCLYYSLSRVVPAVFPPIWAHFHPLLPKSKNHRYLRSHSRRPTTDTRKFIINLMLFVSFAAFSVRFLFRFQLHASPNVAIFRPKVVPCSKHQASHSLLDVITY